MPDGRTRYIHQGEFAVGSEPEAIISTVLGSCVSICLWDPEARVGGMNHMLLPEAHHPLQNLSAGAVDMERMINALVHLGGDRRRLRAKVFGGASMLQGMTDIGRRNAVFAETYLNREGIRCDAVSTGGDLARQIRFWPESGAARQRLVRENVPLKTRPVVDQGHEVELF